MFSLLGTIIGGECRLYNTQIFATLAALPKDYCLFILNDLSGASYLQIVNDTGQDQKNPDRRY